MSIKQNVLGAALGFGVLVAATGANATLVSYNDVFSGGPNGTVVTASTPLSWTHDITDSLNIASDLIQTATLSIVLLDPQAGNERVNINVDLTGFLALVTNVPNNGQAVGYDYNLSSLQISSLLQSDGMLTLTLAVAQQGSGVPNVTFQSSTLSGIADRATQVPEPATLALVGAGLTGMGLLGRRKAARRS
jgi:hypothetical protein